MEHPKFSLLVPCYNAEMYLPIFLENLGRMNKKFDEVLFYNDGSTDRTHEMLKQSGFRFFSFENKGAGAAKNFLARSASHQYIHFHDVDDLMHPDYLLHVEKAILENPDLDVISCNVVWIDWKTQEPIIHWTYNNALLQKDSIKYTLKNPIGGINSTFRQTAFLSIQGFNEVHKIWEDADLHVRLALSGASFIHLEQTLCTAVRYKNSLSANQKYGWYCRMKYLESYLTTFPERITIELFEEFEQCAFNLFLHKDIKNALRIFRIAKRKQFFMPTTNNALILSIKRISTLLAFMVKGFALSFQAFAKSRN